MSQLPMIQNYGRHTHARLSYLVTTSHCHCQTVLQFGAEFGICEKRGDEESSLTALPWKVRNFILGGILYC